MALPHTILEGGGETCENMFPMRCSLRILQVCLLAVAVMVCGCKGHPKPKDKEKAALTKHDKPDLRDEPSDVDFQAFLGRLRKAIEAHDLNTLAQMMTEDFGYSLNPEKSGAGVFQYWDENNLWPELQGIMSEKFVKKGNFFVAPPQFADPAVNYDGYRAGIARVKGSWKFVYFVNG